LKINFHFGWLAVGETRDLENPEKFGFSAFDMRLWLIGLSIGLDQARNYQRAWQFSN
jgi:hypothetical protein